VFFLSGRKLATTYFAPEEHQRRWRPPHFLAALNRCCCDPRRVVCAFLERARAASSLRVARSVAEAKRNPFFFLFTFVTGPRRSLSLKLSETRVYEPPIRAGLGTITHFLVAWREKRRGRGKDPGPPVQSWVKLTRAWPPPLAGVSRPGTSRWSVLTSTSRLRCAPPPLSLDPLGHDAESFARSPNLHTAFPHPQPPHRRPLSLPTRVTPFATLPSGLLPSVGASLRGPFP